MTRLITDDDGTRTFAISTNPPRLEASIADRVISMKDVQSVIEELCYSSHNNHQEMESANSSTAEQKIKMERLMSSIRPDVLRLANERVKLRGDSMFIESGGRFDFHEQHRTDQREAKRDDSSYNRRLHDYLEEFTIEQEKSSNVDALQLALESSDTNQVGSVGTTAGHIMPDSTAHENIGSNLGKSHSGMSFVSERGALSRMTTLELKEANKKNISPADNLVNDGMRVQNIILDIIAKRNSTRESGKISDKSEIVISLDHVHDKIQAILNRAQSARSDNNDDCDAANDVLCEDDSYGGIGSALDRSEPPHKA